MTLARVLTTVALLTFSLTAAAAEPEAAIKYRQSVMKAQGGHMSALGALANGEVAHKGHATAHADALHATARMVPSLFPAGSDKGKTDALAEIWAKSDAFRKAVEALEVSAAKLDAAAEAGRPDALKAAFAEVGKACKACHDDFRKKK